MSRAKWWLVSGIGALVLVGGLYASLVYALIEDEPAQLLACMRSEEPWQAWTCEQVLRRVALTPENVAELNQQGGALYPALMEDPGKAEEMLELFLASGVDIDAGHKLARGRTALHSAASDADIGRIRLLLEHGASPDVRDQDGRTPLDVARLMSAKFPAESKRAEVVRYLEAQDTGLR